MSLKKACLIVKATNSRVGRLRLPTLAWLVAINLKDGIDRVNIYIFQAQHLIKQVGEKPKTNYYSFFQL